MAGNYETMFLEDNLLTENDWATCQQFPVLSTENEMNWLDFSVSSSETHSTPPQSEVTMDSGSDSGSGSQIPLEYSNFCMGDTEFDDIINDLESPPLTPPEELESLDSFVTSQNVQNISLDQLYPHLNNTQHDSGPQLHAASQLHNKATTRCRSGSSSSAYSSQSSTPPPPTNQSGNIFDTAFQRQSTQQNSDEGFYEKQAVMENTKRKGVIQKRSQMIPKEESEFDKAVKDALRETNRLLNMHRNVPEPTTETSNKTECQKAPVIDLRQVCDNVILNGDSSTTQALSNPPVRSTMHEGSLKRKSAKRCNRKFKKTITAESLQAVSMASYTRKMGVPPTQEQAQSTQVTTSTLSSFQIPLSSVAEAAPMRLYVKQEPVSSLYLTTTPTQPTVCNVMSVNNSHNMVIPPSIPINLTHVTPKNEVVLPQSFVVRSDTLHNGASSPLVNISTNGILARPKILPLTNHNQPPSDQKEGKHSQTKSATKPLMGSIGGPKKPIVPAAYPSFTPTVIGVNPVMGLEQRNEQLTIKDLDGRAMKRQQRMIKNREAACQSRQRRKEYVSTLEQQMLECLDDNNKLRSMNQQLRDKVMELENENTRLRSLAGMTTSGQRRAACILMLVLFIGFNIHPLSFLANQSISGEDTPIKFTPEDAGNFNVVKNWPAPVESGFHGRQLLSVEEQGGKSERGVGGVRAGSETQVSSSLKKDSFWMDDLVNNYKKEHLDKILEVLRDTSSISLQRMLRRKLKEELGIRVPMPIPRTRRISYTPTNTHEQRAPDINNINQKLRFYAPKPHPSIKPAPTSVKINLCESLNKNEKQLNETESIRVSKDLDQWIAREKHNKESNHMKNYVNKKPPDRTNKRSRRIAVSPQQRRPTKATGIALYKDKENSFNKFLDLLNRRNDTIYVISLNQDHILLPSTVKNSSLPTKMSLVFPTAPPNETYSNNEVYQTLIQINCEVTATDYLQVKRELLPNSHNHVPNTVQHTTEPTNRKRKAYHAPHATNELKVRRKSKTNEEADATVTDVDL